MQKENSGPLSKELKVFGSPCFRIPNEKIPALAHPETSGNTALAAATILKFADGVRPAGPQPLVSKQIAYVAFGRS